MKSNSLKIIGIGILVLTITYILFLLLYNSLAPTEAEILGAQSREAVSALVSRSQQAGLVRTATYVILFGEIIFFITRFLKSRGAS